MVHFTTGNYTSDKNPYFLLNFSRIFYPESKSRQIWQLPVKLIDFLLPFEGKCIITKTRKKLLLVKKKGEVLRHLPVYFSMF